MGRVFIWLSLAHAGHQPPAELGDGTVPFLIKRAGREVLPRRTVVVGLQIQQQARSPQAVEVVNLTPGQLLCNVKPPHILRIRFPPD